MDPLAGVVGACVIASSAYGLIRSTAAIPLDMNPDRTGRLRQAIESQGDRPHLWRLGPGRLRGIVSVVTKQPVTSDYYRSRLARLGSLSHLTVGVKVSPWPARPRRRSAKLPVSDGGFFGEVRRLQASTRGAWHLDGS
jgi:Co/Zn/Cd efflux system component